jgi:hypothetical protein
MQREYLIEARADTRRPYHHLLPGDLWQLQGQLFRIVRTDAIGAWGVRIPNAA